MRTISYLLVASAITFLLIVISAAAHADVVAILEQQHGELVSAKTDNATSTTEYGTLKTSYDTLNGKWYVRWGQRIDTAIWIFVGLGVLSIGLRIFSVSGVGSGWVGTIASFLSTGIIGILTLGGSLIQMIFDNIHFRKRIALGASLIDATKSGAT
jgi:hypothetical protein